ncbi:redoxin domain-containing protein [Segetibacter koreensis]|uniref:redoxin domain-containing protein n=1 Tax=Segetibacter koreensis TaxID=398037 RepID=UPI000371A90C|nr:TlpA disulfide reductase family protein [Segetibacter koreensis]
MRKLSFIVVLLMVAFYSLAQNTRPVTQIIKRVSAEEVRSFIDTTSVPTIVNFWASWCGPCIREIPWFDSLISKKNLPVKLLLVSLDSPFEDPGKLVAFVKKQGYKGEVVFLNDANIHHYLSIIDKKWTGEIPASIFINKSKKYYQLFNQQLPPKRFELELEKLVQ